MRLISSMARRAPREVGISNSDWDPSRLKSPPRTMGSPCLVCCLLSAGHAETAATIVRDRKIGAMRIESSETRARVCPPIILINRSGTRNAPCCHFCFPAAFAGVAPSTLGFSGRPLGRLTLGFGSGLV